MGIKDDITLLGIKLRGWKWDIEDKLNDQRDAIVRRITTDPYIEGKKSGYEKAADEYKSVYEVLEKKYMETKKIFINTIREKDENLVTLLDKLQQLEKIEKKYDKQLKKFLQQFIERYAASPNMGAHLEMSSSLADFIKPIYDKKFNEAEKEGYEEAKEAYQKKISKLKIDLKKLIKESEQELAKHDKLISKTILCINEKFSSIAKLQMQIAELKLLS